eukprot:9092034-Pyramimonas_sp.AAC.1
MSGVEAFLPTDDQISKLQSRVIMHARRAMRGLATKEVNGHKVSISNAEVCRYWQMAPLEIELRAMRIK